jgi:hypothetical protein
MPSIHERSDHAEKMVECSDVYQAGGQEHAFCPLQRIAGAAANSLLGCSIPDMTLDCIE